MTVVMVLLVMAAATSLVPLRTAVVILTPAAVAEDVLEHHDGVVDDATDGHRQPAQGDDVDGQPGDPEQGDGREDGQRDAHRGDQRGAQAEQEGEDGQDREGGAQHALADEAVAGLLDEHRRSGWCRMPWLAATIRRRGMHRLRHLDRVGPDRPWRP